MHTFEPKGGWAFTRMLQLSQVILNVCVCVCVCVRVRARVRGGFLLNWPFIKQLTAAT